MLQTLRTRFPAVEDFRLEPRVVMFAIAMLAAVAAISIAFYLWREPAGYQPLYGAGEAFQPGEVIPVLDDEGIRYRLHPQTGQVLVREDHLARARMQLAARGVQVSVPAGYELFDRDEPLGTSQFVQDVRLKRSLEGELARTIMSVRGVDQARVHLARDENRSFVVGRREPARASVMLQLAPGVRLQAEQVAAIVNLVSNSVPRLDAADVSVVDQHGALLSRGLDEHGGLVNTREVVEDYRNTAVSNIEQVLAPVLGAGNFRISVAPDFDFARREETVQTYGEAPRVRNEILRSESALDQLALGVPGSLSHLPLQLPPARLAEADAANEGEEGNPAATSMRQEANRTLDYDQSVTHVRHAPFALRSQSVAVVLNAAAAPEGGWDAAARDEIEAMVRSAVGFSAARGDQLTLSMLPFSVVEDILPALQWWENPQVYAYARSGALLLIALLILLMVVRPAMRAVTRREETLPAVRDGEALEGELDYDDPEFEPTRERAALPRAEEPAVPRILSELSPMSEIRLPAPGSGLEVQIEHLQMLARNDPERVSEVIKHWIGRNDRDLNPA